MNLRIVYYDKQGKAKYNFFQSEETDPSKQEKVAKEIVAKEGGKFHSVQTMA